MRMHMRQVGSSTHYCDGCMHMYVRMHTQNSRAKEHLDFGVIVIPRKLDRHEVYVV